jgi:hypothetical protein
MQINLIYDSSTATAPQAFFTAMTTVVNNFDALFTNNVTVNINVGWGVVNAPDGAHTIPNTAVATSYRNTPASYTYTQVRNALIATAQASGSPDQQAAVAQLPVAEPAGLGQHFVLGTAEAKALGLVNANATPLDGAVGFAVTPLFGGNTPYAWYYGTGTPTASNQYSFIATAEHEITEIMGRIAWAHKSINFNGTNQVGQINDAENVIDLFRYAGPNQRQLGTSGPSYFSLDGGATDLKDWQLAGSTGNDGDLVDWVDNHPTGDAFDKDITPGEFLPMSAVDLMLMNILGWNMTNPPVPPNPPPPAATTADMILRHGSDGQYYIYDIGNNSLLAAYKLGQVGTDWKWAGIGGFFGSDTTDMLLRNATSGGFEVYDISNNNLTNAAFMGTVGLDWQVMGFGNFSSFGENDMIMRNSKNGGVEVYDIRNNQIIGANFMGAVGLDWQVAGFGNFSSRGTSDMILRNVNSGGLEVYDINSNQVTGAAFMGNVGLDWSVLAFGNFSGSPGETDMIMRNANSGGMVIYDIAGNQVTSAFFIGSVGLDWQFAGVGPIHSPGASDLVLRNTKTGAFEVYDIAGNTLIGAGSLGAVGLDWSLGGIAVDPPTGAMGAADDSTSRLVQAMAGFTGEAGAAADLNTAAAGADALQQQQQFLTTSQHT